MKRFVTCCMIVFTLMFAFAGCAKDAEPTESVTVLDEGEAYRARIEELETQLQKQREDRYISDAVYTATIEKLQSKLDALSPEDESNAGEDGAEELVFRYRLENGKAIVTGYSGTSTLVSIPATLDGYEVVALGERAFEGQKIAAVVLPDGLEAVGWFSFYGCESLIDITIPDSVTSIGYAVFDGCPNLTIVCSEDSYAARYAESYGLPHIAP